jgi:hypothetical protein
MPRRKDPRIPAAVLDQLLAGADPRTALQPNGLIDDLKKALAERILKAGSSFSVKGSGGLIGSLEATGASLGAASGSAVGFGAGLEPIPVGRDAR